MPSPVVWSIRLPARLSVAAVVLLVSTHQLPSARAACSVDDPGCRCPSVGGYDAEADDSPTASTASTVTGWVAAGGLLLTALALARRRRRWWTRLVP